MADVDVRMILDPALDLNPTDRVEAWSVSDAATTINTQEGEVGLDVDEFLVIVGEVHAMGRGQNNPSIEVLEHAVQQTNRHWVDGRLCDLDVVRIISLPVLGLLAEGDEGTTRVQHPVDVQKDYLEVAIHDLFRSDLMISLLKR